MMKLLKILLYFLGAVVVVGVVLEVFAPNIFQKIAEYAVMQMFCGLWPWGC